MASRIKGITVEIGGDATNLQKALSDVQTKLTSTQNALKDVNRLLKLDPSNITLLAQKQKLLGEQINNTKDKLERLKQAEAQFAGKDLTAEQQTQFQALQREIADTEISLKGLESQYAKIQGVDLRSHAEQIADVGKKWQDVGGKISDAGDKIAGVGDDLTQKVTLPIVAAGGAAVKLAADFESSMSQVQATMGITKDATSELDGQTVNTMDALNDLAKTMGETTAFSAKECADAVNYIALAGYDTEQMYDTLPVVLNLAAAGGFDLAKASDMVTDAMSALGKDTEYADTMVDQMARTASITNTSVEQLGDAILTVGGTAKGLSGDTAELDTALGILANSGIKGAEGGTHLRNVLLSLQNPTKDATEMLDKYTDGVYDAEGKMRPLNAVLGELNTSLETMTDAEKQTVISKIFNKTDLAAAQALLSGTGDEWTKLQQSIMDSGGSAQQMADTQLDNLNGQMTLLKSAIEGLAISFGEVLMPAIKKVTDKIQDAVDWLNGLDESQKEQIVRIAAIVAAIGPVLAILGRVISTFGSITSGIGKIMELAPAIGGSMGAVAGTVAAVVAIIAVLVGSFATLWQTNEDFRNRMTEIWNELKGAFEDFSSGLLERINALGFDFENFTEVITAAWQTFCDFMAPIFEGVWNQVVNIISTAFDLILDVWDLFESVFTGDWEGAWEAVKKIFSDLWDFCLETFNSWKEAFTGIVDEVLSWFGSSWEEGWQAAEDFFVGIWDDIVSFITDLPARAYEWGADFIDGFIDGINSMVDWLIDKVANISDTIASYLHFSRPDKGALHDYEEWMPDMMKGLAKGIKNNMGLVQNAISSVSDMMSSELTVGADLGVNAVPALAGVSGGSVATYGDTVINVYGGNNVNVNDLAKAVEFRINRNLQRGGRK